LGRTPSGAVLSKSLMVEEKAFQQRIQQIESLIAKLDEASDPSLRDRARALVRTILEFHGAGLERMMQIVSQAGESGERLIGRFDRDDLVRGLLLLHGVHPLPFEERVRRALDKAGAILSAHGARVELLGVENGVVRLQLIGTLKACGASGVKATLEEAIYEAAPDLAELVVEGGAEAPPAAFVPLTNLLNQRVVGLGGPGRP
jgi:Fe-S cluster biogenesis protein NfuA